MSKQLTRDEFWAMAGRRLAAMAARIPYDYPELYQRILDGRKKEAEQLKNESEILEAPQE